MTDLARRESEFLLYTAPDGAVKVGVLFRDETVWLTQRALAELFGVKVPAITKHLKNIFESGEPDRAATVSKMEIVQSESAREVLRAVALYNLDAIIAVGYRVNSSPDGPWLDLPDPIQTSTGASTTTRPTSPTPKRRSEPMGRCNCRQWEYVIDASQRSW
jgi:hypothetical protein